MHCAQIDGHGITLMLEGEQGRVRGQIHSTGAADASFEVGRFDIPWKVLAKVLAYSNLSFASPFGFVLLRRCEEVVELCYASDLGNQYAVTELAVVSFQAVLDRLETERHAERVLHSAIRAT